MSIVPRLRLGVSVLAAAAASVLLAGCVTAPPVASVGPSASASATPGPSPTTSSAPAPTECPPGATASYAPSSTSDYADAIKARGYLLVGVSADTRLLGAVNPANPTVFEGFDIAMAQLVARSIFGTVTEKNLQFKVISTANRIPELQKNVSGDLKNVMSGGVDLVARAFTMNCARWQQVAFSAEYYEAHQGVMIPSRSAPTVKTLDDLSGKRVCAPNGSTSLVTIKQENPKVETVGVVNHTDCLVQLQLGRVDAITGDDAILAGFKAQDPTTQVIKGIRLSKEPYGLGVPLKHKDFAAYINSVLEQARKDGSWQKAYDGSLKSALGPGTQPTPLYGRS
jgi:polar amino acid transport system substrate-binding protein